MPQHSLKETQLNSPDAEELRRRETEKLNDDLKHAEVCFRAPPRQILKLTQT